METHGSYFIFAWKNYEDDDTTVEKMPYHDIDIFPI